MASFKELLDRLFLNNGNGSPDQIAHVTPDGLTIVDSRKLFQRADVRKMFDSMKEKKNGTRQVVITAKK